MSFVCWCHKLMWTLPALDIVCLVVYTLRVLCITKAQKRHPSSARGCIHSSEIPFAIKPCITGIGAVSHVVSLYTKLEFAAFSRVVLRFVSSLVYSLHLSRYWVFWSFSCSIICLPFRIRPLQRWDCLRKWPFAWPFGWTFGILGPDGRRQPTRSWHNRL
jgi:hypothetical protein